MSPFKPGFSRSLVKNSTTVPKTQDWVWIIELYTLQKVTYELDRLPALSSLARQAQAAGWCRYAAGLWLHDLVYFMCWRVINRKESIRYPAMIRQGQQKRVKVLITLQKLNIKTGKDHTGKVIDGHILVSGREFMDYIGGIQPTELLVKIIPWYLVNQKVSYMVLGPAKERKNVPDSIETSNSWERWGMITEGYRENEVNQIQWYSRATPFENLIFV